MKRVRNVAVSILAAIGLLFVVVSILPVDTWWAQRLAGSWPAPKGDILIVLGGSMLDSSMIGETSYWRSVYAVRVWRENHFRRVILTGGPPANPAAGAMKVFLVSEGIPAAIIETETQSGSTHENALAVRRLVAADPGRKILLTSDYHVYRAARTFAKAGVAVTAVPFPDVIKHATRWYNRWPAFLELCTETVKIGYYTIRGWM